MKTPINFNQDINKLSEEATGKVAGFHFLKLIVIIFILSGVTLLSSCFFHGRGHDRHHEGHEHHDDRH